MAVTLHSWLGNVNYNTSIIVISYQTKKEQELEGPKFGVRVGCQSGFQSTLIKGARTPAWLATDEIGQRETGKYFEHMQMRRCRFGEDSVGVEALYQACLAY
jgi:hypothetical protein